MERILLLIPVAVAAAWFVQRYRSGAFRRVPRPAASAEEQTGWVFRPEDYGLVPDDKLDVENPGPDPEGTRALNAACTGDWRPAAALLASSDPEWRWRRVGKLASRAVEDDSWLRAWRAAHPGDPTAALIAADSVVVLAGRLRGSARASRTTREQFDSFHRVLAQAPDAFAEAARLGPADPCPYIGLIPVAMGLGWPHDRMNALWGEIVARAPYHVGAHVAALQYWCAKWHGSHELMHAFAESAAGKAPPGSLLTILRLQAIYEELLGNRTSDPRYHSPQTAMAIDALLADVNAAPPGHPWLPSARHLLVWFLRAQRRHAEAAEQLRMVDGYIGTLPWSYNTDPVGFYTAVREHLILADERLAREGRDQQP